MSSHVFKIGDRARIARCRNFPSFNGREAVITSGMYSLFSCGEFIDVYDITIIGVASEIVWASAQLLEPLNPPKSQIHEILAMKDLPNRDCKIARVGECANG